MEPRWKVAGERKQGQKRHNMVRSSWGGSLSIPRVVVLIIMRARHDIA